VSSTSRAALFLVLAGWLFAPEGLEARSDDISRDTAAPENVARSLPFLYTIPARGGVPGRLRAELTISAYSLYSTVSPSTQVADEEEVLTTRVRLSLSLTERLSAWVEPARRRVRWRFGSSDELKETAWADTWIGARLSPRRSESLLRFGLAGMVLLPTGAEDAGRAGDFTTGITDYAVVGLCDIDLSRFFESACCALYINCGYRWHRNEVDGSLVWPDVSYSVVAGEDAEFNDVMLLRVGWRYAAPQLTMEAEVRGDQFIHARRRMEWRENPISANAGLRRWLGRRCWIRLGGEVALSSGGAAAASLSNPEKSFPDWVIFASFGAVMDLLRK